MITRPDGTSVESFDLRRIAIPAFGPSLLFGLGKGAILPIVALSVRDLGGSPALAALVVMLIGIGSLLSNVPASLITARYGELCRHYAMIPSRNNRGLAHENGTIEVANRHLKRALDQALMLRGHRDFDTLEVSQQCVVVIAEDDAAARAALEKAKRIYGGHLGSALEEHGIWGSPARVIDCIERHRKLGCTMFPVEFFGRDTREPARLFAEAVMTAFR